MRDEYVELIKQYVASKPNYKDTIREIKADLLSIGASDAEFEEAIKQLGLPLSLIHAYEAETQEKSTKKGKAGKPFLTYAKKHMVELDIATHMVIVIAILTVGVLYFLSPTATQFLPMFTKANLPEQAAQLATVNPDALKQQIIPQVYANTMEVNSDAVFSIKPTNITLSVSGTPKRTVYGFFPYWMLANEEKINIDVLTTIALFGLEVDGGGGIQTKLSDGEVDPGWSMWNDPKVDTFIKRAKKKRIALELTIKGFDNTSIEKLVLSDTAQKTFIANAIHLLQLKSLDGLNLDFEYVGNPSPAVTDGFTRLIINLRAEMKRQIPDSTLTLATYVNAAAIPQLVDVQLTADHIDAFVVMGYDIHTPKGEPGPVAPMEGASSIIGFMQSYLEKVPSEKIILAVPYYGYDWSLSPQPDERAKIYPYAEIMETTKKIAIQWDDVAKTPYYTYTDAETKSSRVVHFENTRSLGHKFDYINDKNLKGVGIWALGYDGLSTDLQSLLLEKFAR